MAFVKLVTDAEIQREKAKARQLRGTAWWQRRRSAGRCGYCGRPTPPRELTMDHRVPLVRGGRSTKGNLVAACKACNTAKKYRLTTEWEEYLRRLARATDEPPAEPSEERRPTGGGSGAEREAPGPAKNIRQS